MQYHQIAYFVGAVRQGSIRKAARELGVSQPNLSTAIIALEKEIGTQLLDRSNRGVSLTPEGQRFFSLAQDIVDKTAMLKNLYREAPPPKRFHALCVATNPSQITLRTLREMQPLMQGDGYRVTMRNLSVIGCASSVKSMESELGVVFITSGQQKKYRAFFAENQLEYHRVSTRTCCVNLGRRNPLFDRELVDYKELLRFPLVRFVEDDLSLLDFGAAYGDWELGRFQKVYYFDSDSSIISFIRQTDAIKFGFPWCREDYEEAGVRCVELSDVKDPLELGWIKRKNQGQTEIAALFVQTLVQLFGDRP